MKLFLLLSLAACSKQTAPPKEISFRRDVYPVLARNCTTAGCHGASGTQKVHLDFREAAAALRSLRDRPARDRPGWTLVAPGAPAKSFLVDKLTGRLVGNEGARMPLDPDLDVPVAASVLAPFVENTLIPWIAQGAQDN